MGYANKVKEGGDFKPFPRGLKDGSNRRRVLPGIHTCSEDGTWKKKYATHTYAVPRENDPEKKDYYTFHCVEVVEWVNREKVVLETCPECVLIADRTDDLTKLQTKLKEELKSGQRTKDDVRKLLRPHIDWKKRHGRSFWWAVNTLDGDGKYATDKWPNDVMKQFDALKKKLKDEDNIGAILPIDQGVWVDIVKTPGNETGTGFPEYNVTVVEERLEGGLKRVKLAPLAPESADEAEKTCWDINDPGIITLTRDQVKALAASGDAPAVVRGIFAQSVKTAPKAESKPATATPSKPVETARSTPAKVTPTPEPEPEPLTPGNDVPAMDSKPPKEESEDDRTLRLAEEAVARARARRDAARKAEQGASASPPVPPPTPKPEPTPAKVEEKPAPKAAPAKKGADEDIDSFMKEYGLGEDDPV